MPQLDALPLDLDPDQEAALLTDVEGQLGAALETHRQREEKLNRLKRSYRALPEHEKKTFPWDGASNVVIPIVGITVDNIVARLTRAFLGSKDVVEAQIKEPSIDADGKLTDDFRDWANMFMDKSGARDRLRTSWHDMTIDGTVYIKNRWASKTRVVHAYGTGGGAITETEVVDYEGPVWDVIPAVDCIFPEGFDEWESIPWVANRMRLTEQELLEAQTQGMYTGIDNDFLKNVNPRDDSTFRTNQEVNRVQGENKTPLYQVFEIWGKFKIPKTVQAQQDPNAATVPPEYADLILTYCRQPKKFLRKIYNPFFGRSRHIVRIPFLHMAHQIDGMGAAEQVEQFQIEASTAHNQTIDAATAAIAGIIVTTPNASDSVNGEIYPGKKIVTDKPSEDVQVLHLSMGNSTLPSVEQSAAFWAEKRSGVNAYSMGVESPVAGSRATATGTTALISEGNLRFWVSIDDMRDAIVSLFYLTLQLEQQMRPQGTPISASRILTLPQGDLRETIGLRLMMSSEKINRDIEVQQLQILIQVLNDYYARIMQLGGVIINPQFPPPQKMLAIQVMQAASNLVKRFVERFDIEDIDQIVPNIMQAVQMMGGVQQTMNQMGGQGAATPGAPPNATPGMGTSQSGPTGAVPGGAPPGPVAMPRRFGQGTA